MARVTRRSINSSLRSLIALVVVAWLQGVLTAQQEVPDSQSQPPRTSPITVVGCLTRAHTGAAEAVVETLVLTNARPAVSAVVGGGAAEKRVTRYVLEDDAWLADHVGQTVEVTGTLQPPSKNSAVVEVGITGTLAGEIAVGGARPLPPQAQPMSQTTRSTTNGPRLRVTRSLMISYTCN